MRPEEFLEKLDIEPVDNQSIANSMAAGVDSASLYGALPGSESLIEGKFASLMPKAEQTAKLDTVQNAIRFDIADMEI